MRTMEFEKTLEPAIGPALGYPCYTVKHGVIKVQRKRLFKKPQNIALFILLLESDYDEDKYKRIVFNTFSDLQDFVSAAKELAVDFKEIQKEKLNNLETDKDSSRRLNRLQSEFRKKQNSFWDEVLKQSFSVTERS